MDFNTETNLSILISFERNMDQEQLANEYEEF